MNKINSDIEEMNLEILLLNTRIVSVIKVQTVIDKFMKKKRTPVYSVLQTPKLIA